MLSPTVVLQLPYGLISLPSIATCAAISTVLAQHSAPRFPASVQQVLHALIITQQGGTFLPPKLLMERSFTVLLDIISVKDILDVILMDIILEEFLIKKSSKIVVTYKASLKASPPLLTGLQHWEGKLLHTNIMFGSSCELQQWQRPKARENSGEEDWQHPVHSHIGCRPSWEQVWQREFLTSRLAQPMVGEPHHIAHSFLSLSWIEVSATHLCSAPGLGSCLLFWKFEGKGTSSLWRLVSNTDSYTQTTGLIQDRPRLGKGKLQGISFAQQQVM